MFTKTDYRSKSDNANPTPSKEYVKLERKSKFYHDKSICATKDRVVEYVKQESTEELLKNVNAKNVSVSALVLVGCTGAGAVTGAGVGGLIGNVPGVAIGGAAGGVAGFAIGGYYATQIMKPAFTQNYERWKSEGNNAATVKFLRKVLEDDPIFEPYNCPLGLTVFRNPVMITKCGHSFEEKELISFVNGNEDNPSDETCPLCRTEYTYPEDVVDDIVTIAELKKIYAELGNKASTSNDYSPPIRAAFKAMSLDLGAQLRHLYVEADAKLLLQFNEGKIEFDVFQRRRNSLITQFAPIFKA